MYIYKLTCQQFAYNSLHLELKMKRFNNFATVCMYSNLATLPNHNLKAEEWRKNKIVFCASY